MQVQEPINHQNFYIGGAWTKPATANRIDVIGANSGLSIGSVPDGSNADIDRAVAAARRALDGGWADSTPAERAAIMNKFADAMEKRAERLTRAVSMQNGMPLSLAEAFEGGYVVGSFVTTPVSRRRCKPKSGAIRRSASTPWCSAGRWAWSAASCRGTTRWCCR